MREIAIRVPSGNVEEMLDRSQIQLQIFPSGAAFPDVVTLMIAPKARPPVGWRLSARPSPAASELQACIPSS